MRRPEQFRRRLTSIWLWGCFAMGGLAISLIVFPALLLVPVAPRIRRRWAMTLVHYGFAGIVGACRRFGVIRFDIENAQKLRTLGRAIVIANHPSYLDVVVLLALMPRACCIVTSRHWRNPLFFGVVRAAGYLRNDGGPALVEASMAALADDVPLIVFPEGTRSPSPGQLGRFSRGFAHIALKHQCPIVPVLIDCDPPIYTKQHRWHYVPEQQPHLRVRVFDDTLQAAPETGTEPAFDTSEDPQDTGLAPVAARRIAVDAQRYFTLQLAQHGFTRN